MRKLFSLRESGFAGIFWKLAKWSTLAQIISFLLYPLITRLYSASDFGIRAIFISLVSTILSFSTLGLELTVPLAKNEEDGVHLAMGGFLVSFFFASLSFVIFFFIDRTFLRLSGLLPIEPFLFLIPIALVLNGLYQVLSHWAVRKASYQKISITRVYRALWKGSVELTGGVTGVGPIGLIVGWVVGSFGGVFNFFKEFKSDFYRALQRKGVLMEVMGKLALFKSTVKYVGFSNLVYVLNLHVPILLFSKFYSPDFVGHFSIAMLAVAIPNTILVDSFSAIYFSELSKKLRERKKEALTYFDLSLKRVIFLSSLVFIITLLFGKLLVVFILGEKWILAGDLVPYLIILFPAYFLFSLSFHTFNATHNHSWQLIFNLLKGVLIGGLFFFVWKWELEVFLTIFMLVMIVFVINLVQITVARILLRTYVV